MAERDIAATQESENRPMSSRAHGPSGGMRLIFTSIPATYVISSTTRPFSNKASGPAINTSGHTTHDNTVEISQRWIEAKTAAGRRRDAAFLPPVPCMGSPIRGASQMNDVRPRATPATGTPLTGVTG